MRIGEVIPVEREIELNAGKKTVQVKVVHTGDRPSSGLSFPLL